MKILIKQRQTKKILFEHDCEDNTIKITLEIAIKKDAYLGGADLRNADLGDANLGGADLGGTYLRGTYLRNANLGGAYLRNANLRGADLGGADLRNANLGDANLRGAYLRGADLNVNTPPLLDHTFISEILWRMAKAETQKDFAARLQIEVNQCWKYFYQLAQQKQVADWAEEILSQWKEYKNKIQETKKNDFTGI